MDGAPRTHARAPDELHHVSKPKGPGKHAMTAHRHMWFTQTAYLLTGSQLGP